MRRGESPMVSSRLSHEYRQRWDEIAQWLHETRQLPNSRRAALEYMIDLAYHGELREDRDHGRSDVSTT
jgi:hypothetical protein